MPDNPITRDWAIEALSDRKWHTQYELINRAGRFLRPEVASRKYYSETRKKLDEKCKDCRTAGLDKAILGGTKRILQRVLNALLKEGLLEYRGKKYSTSRESRLIGSFCWACRRFQATMLEDGTCGKCPEHCPHCGRVLDDKKDGLDNFFCRKCRKKTRKKPKQEEPKQEEPKQEEPKQEEPKQEEPKQEEPKPPKHFEKVRLRFSEKQEGVLDISQPENRAPSELDLDDDSPTIIYHSSLKPRKPKRPKRKPKPQPEPQPTPEQIRPEPQAEPVPEPPIPEPETPIPEPETPIPKQIQPEPQAEPEPEPPNEVVDVSTISTLFGIDILRKG